MDATDALFDAASRLSVDYMRRALKEGADANAQRDEDYGIDDEDEIEQPRLRPVAVFVVLAGACAGRCNRQLAALQLLREHGGLSEDAATEALIAVASGSCDIAVIRALIAAGAGFARDGTTALHILFDAPITRLHVKAGAEVNAADDARQRPLHSLFGWSDPSRIREHVAIAKALIAGGADVNALDAQGRSVLVQRLVRGRALEASGDAAATAGGGWRPDCRRLRR